MLVKRILALAGAGALAVALLPGTAGAKPPKTARAVTPTTLPPGTSSGSSKAQADVPTAVRVPAGNSPWGVAIVKSGD